MRILIINQHTNNFGDDLAGIALIQNLLSQKKITRIDLVYNTNGVLPIEDSRVHHNRDITLRTIGAVPLIKYFMFGERCKIKNPLLSRLLTIIKSADYIFVSPCGANIGVYRDWGFLIRLMIVTRAGCKPIFHLNTIGDSGSMIFNYVAKRILRKSKIYVRERVSAEYLSSIGINAKAGTDTAFSYISNECITKKPSKLVYIPTPLSWHPNFKKYDVESNIFESIAKNVAVFAKQMNLEVVLVTHLNSDEERRLYENTQKIIESIGVKCAISKAETVFDYYKDIADASCVISMRYHPLIIAAKNQIPFLALSYESKMNEVCRYCNMGKMCLDLVDYSDEKFIELLSSLAENQGIYRKELKSLLPSLVEKSEIPLKETVLYE